MKRNYKTGLTVTLLFLLCGSFSFAQQQVQQWNRFEVVLKQIYNGNAFANVKLTAKFISKDTTYIADGFYDGDNTFIIRFMPEKPGHWTYVTRTF